jgi:hypothetical protein
MPDKEVDAANNAVPLAFVEFTPLLDMSSQTVHKTRFVQPNPFIQIVFEANGQQPSPVEASTDEDTPIRLPQERENTNPNKLFADAVHGLSLISRDFRLVTGFMKQIRQQIEIRIQQLQRQDFPEYYIFSDDDNLQYAIMTKEQGLALQAQVLASPFFLALENFVMSRVPQAPQYLPQTSAEPQGEDFDINMVIGKVNRLLLSILPQFVVDHLMQRIDLSQQAGGFLYGNFSDEQEKAFRARVHLPYYADACYNEFGCICAIGKTQEQFFMNIVHEVGHCIDFEMLEDRRAIGINHGETVSTAFETIAASTCSVQARRDYCKNIDRGIFAIYLTVCSLMPESGNLYGPTSREISWTDVLRSGVAIAEKRLGANPNQFQDMIDQNVEKALIEHMRSWLQDITKCYPLERMLALRDFVKHPVTSEDSALSFLDAVLKRSNPERVFAEHNANAIRFTSD